MLGLFDVVIPHAHARLREGTRQPVEQRAAEDRAALLLAAMTIHNVPDVIVDELIPENHAGGHELAATFALLAGFDVMVGLDTTL